MYLRLVDNNVGITGVFYTGDFSGGSYYHPQLNLFVRVRPGDFIASSGNSIHWGARAIHGSRGSISLYSKNVAFLSKNNNVLQTDALAKALLEKLEKI